MARVNYILGAGASAKAVPVVAQLEDGIKFILGEVNHPDFNQKVKSKAEYEYAFNDVIKDLKEDLNWLLINESQHATIDTFAKKLWITRDFDELNRLKLIFSLFLSVYQAIKGVDPRYDFFLAALLGADARFSDDVNIVSWNYDSQIELAYSHYIKTNKLSDCAARLNLGLRDSKEIKVSYEGFNLLKVNGSTSIYDDLKQRSFYFLDNVKYASPEEMWGQSLFFYSALRRRRQINLSSLAFAWEGQESESPYYDNVSSTFLDTEILVIIGYSFSFFNRVIDRAILRNAVKLKKVYIQDLNPDPIKEKLVQSLPRGLELDKISIDPIKNANEFFIPHEL